MTSIQKVIKDAGMNPIQCPSCGKSIHTNTLWPGFFRRIIDTVRGGDTVTVSGFGNFRARLLKGRTLKSPLLSGGKVKFGDRQVLRFHASATAKKVLNGQEVEVPEDIDKDDVAAAPKASKKKAVKKVAAKKEAPKAAKKKPEPAKPKKGKAAPEPEEGEDEFDDEELELEDDDDLDDEDEDQDDEE